MRGKQNFAGAKRCHAERARRSQIRRNFVGLFGLGLRETFMVGEGGLSKKSKQVTTPTTRYWHYKEDENEEELDEEGLNGGTKGGHLPKAVASCQ